MGTIYEVAATGLNLRQQPDSTAAVLAVLPRRTLVMRLDPQEWGEGWWRVRAEFSTVAYEGYVAGRLLRLPPAPDTTGGPLDLTGARLRLLAPNARAEVLEGLLAAFATDAVAAGLTSGLRLRHFLAQCAHESAGFRRLTEIGDEAYFTRMYEHNVRLARRLGNTQPGDGARYRGRGIIQLTGRFNYARFGRELGLDLEGQPETAAEPVTGARLAIAYWRVHDLNALADRDDLEAVTRAINGGLNGLDDRREYLAAATRIWTDAVA